jgi:hypothetical protein
MTRPSSYITLFVCLLFVSLSAQPYPDQHYVLEYDSLCAHIKTSSGVVKSNDGKRLILAENRTSGFVILSVQSTRHPFNRGLPSWNGTAAGSKNGFMIQMRFPWGDGWSPWLTAGYWKDYIWSSYGRTSYGQGAIDYDYVVLDAYQTRFQFKILMNRDNTNDPSPTLHKLSFFVGDSRTTSAINISAIVADNPDPIFITTDFYYQYGLDPQIGGSICSPTSVSMILRSYDIEVEPVPFARDTYDPYWGIFGMWPRVVQNASQYGLDGAVTRYRSWSEARETLAAGGRIAMSVGPPLYGGHLMMLAGFTDDGRPIVHDPAKSNGYAYVFDKTSLSHSWFDKGGIAYTFYPSETPSLVTTFPQQLQPTLFQLQQNYPNPFNASTTISYSLEKEMHILISAYDINGRQVATLIDNQMPAGEHVSIWDATRLPSGTYFIRLISHAGQQAIRCVLAK